MLATSHRPGGALHLRSKTSADLSSSRRRQAASRHRPHHVRSAYTDAVSCDALIVFDPPRLPSHSSIEVHSLNTGGSNCTWQVALRESVLSTAPRWTPPTMRMLSASPGHGHRRSLQRLCAGSSLLSNISPPSQVETLLGEAADGEINEAGSRGATRHRRRAEGCCPREKYPRRPH